MHGFGGWYMGGMWFWWVAILAVAGGVLWRLFSRHCDRTLSEPPEQILKRRYANGEIDRDQYERMRSDLKT